MKFSGATVSSRGRWGRLGAWFAHHRRVASSSLGSLLASPVASLMTWLVIGIALALPAILYVLLQNLATLSEQGVSTHRASLFLVPDASVEVAQQLAHDIGQQEGVEKTVFISATDALAEFQEKSGFGALLHSLEHNPLPHLIEVILATKDPLVISRMGDGWQAKPLIARVSLDQQWLERLSALLSFGKRLVGALGLVLSAGAVLIMGSIIRLTILNRREEIEIVKLFGGTNAFVRRPFLYSGFWYGLGGALSALLLVQGSVLLLVAPMKLVTHSYGSAFVLQGLDWVATLVLCGTGILLGVLGAVLAVGRHLSEIRPQ